MGISGKGINNYLTLRTKIPNKKQKARIDITDITNHYFRRFLKAFDNSPYLCYKKNQVHYETTEAYFLLINQFYKIIKIKNHVWLHTKGVKLDVNGTKRVDKTIELFNKTIQFEIT